MTQMVNAPINHTLILLNCHTFVQNAKLTTKIHIHILDTKMGNAQLKVKPTTEAGIFSQLRQT